MANVSFTRDEVILALDVLYCAGEERLTAQSDAILELSDLLNRLPIHPVSARGEIFRNPHGVFDQIMSFQRSYKANRKDRHVGYIFYETAREFEGRHDDLHAIAETIRRNIHLCENTLFGSSIEEDGFPEGILVGHLHRAIEVRDGIPNASETRCSICHLSTLSIYNCGNLIEMHLTVPVTELDEKKRYTSQDFISVCPNCHAALHRYRPWLTKDSCGALLR